MKVDIIMINLSLHYLSHSFLHTDFLTIPMRKEKQDITIANNHASFLMKSFIKFSNTNLNLLIHKSTVKDTLESAIKGNSVYPIHNLTVYNQNQFSYFTTIDILESRFLRCNGDNGGAICIPREGMNPTFSSKNTVYAECSSSKNGGAIFGYCSNITMTGNCFGNCKATYSYHALFVETSEIQFNFSSVLKCGQSKQQNTLVISSPNTQSSEMLTFIYNMNSTKNKVSFQGAVLSIFGYQECRCYYCINTENIGSSLYHVQKNTNGNKLELYNCSIINNSLFYAPFSAMDIEKSEAGVLVKFCRYLNNNIRGNITVSGIQLVSVTCPRTEIDNTLLDAISTYFQVKYYEKELKLQELDVSFFDTPLCQYEYIPPTTAPPSGNSKLIGIITVSTFVGLILIGLIVYGIFKYKSHLEYEAWQSSYQSDAMND